MKEITAKERTEFLSALSKLSRRYKITIAGCGCCGSPFLLKLGDTSGRYVIDEKDNDKLNWKATTENKDIEYDV